GARCRWALVVTKGERERGHSGYNLLVIEKGTPGFEVSRTLQKLGMHSSDTAELVFEDCHVPAANLIGEEGEGFKQLMWELQGEHPVREISQAKLLATQVACEVADAAIQIRGGHGYMREFPVERAWRDARLARIGAGTDEIMKEIIAKSYGL